MATSAISNTLTDPSGTALADVVVVARLKPGNSFRTSDNSEVSTIKSTTTNGSGAWSLTLEENDNIVPAGTYYEIEEQIPVSAGGAQVWRIQVGASDATLRASLLSTLPTDAISGNITQDTADARYLMLSESQQVFIDVKRDHGAAGDGTTDDTAAIQAAIDAAQTYVTASAGAPIVLFPPGRYVISDTIEWKSASLVGTWPNNSVRIFWNGVEGGTAITKNTVLAGGTSYGLMENLNFRNGTAEPGTWLDLSSDAGVDAFLRLREVHFIGTTSDCIKITRWINCHWEHLRFDNIGGYAIRLTPESFLASFVLDGFTYDHNRSSGPGSGFMMIDNTANAQSNAGPMEIRNGRIEINTAWGGNQAIVEIIQPSTTSSRVFGLLLSNISYQDVVGMANDVLLYRNTANTSAAESLMLVNFRQTGLSAVRGGTWPAAVPAPPLLTSYGFFVQQAGNADNLISDSLRIQARSDNTAPVAFYSGTEANARLTVSNQGALQWGSGSATADVQLSRSAADTLALADADNLAVGTTTGTKIGTATTQKLGFYNATPVVQPAANADTSGATLGQLETEVNELKATLRSLGLLAT